MSKISTALGESPDTMPKLQSNDVPAMEHMPAEALKEVATYFQVLSEPTRLQILNILHGGDEAVSALGSIDGVRILHS